MKKIKLLVINGANINMLGKREPEIYGEQDYASLKSFIKLSAKQCGCKCKIVQSNSEGRLVDLIQKSYKKYDGIIINAGAYTHTSIALRDALLSVGLPFVEVHLTDVSSREDFRKTSYISDIALKTIVGKGFDGYRESIKFLSGSLTAE